MENAVRMEWLEDPAAEQQRRVRHTLLASLCAHLLVVSSLYFTPAPAPQMIPDAITVSLIAALPSPPAPPKAAAKAAPKALPKPEQKVKILPKRAPSAEARPRKRAEPVVARPVKPEELDYDDALAKLREQLGESAPVEPSPAELAEADQAAFDKLLAEARTSSRGVEVAPELAKWTLNVKRHLRAKWITPPEFRESGLVTELLVELAADGSVLGTPEIKRSSGNPFYDDNTVRAVMSASPLPPPPVPGTRTIIFTPEE